MQPLPKALKTLLVTLLIFPFTQPAWSTTLPKGFVDITEVIPNVLLEIRYHGEHNFLGTRVDGYEAPKCILTREAADALAKVQDELIPYSLSLKIYDCYRPQRAVDHFVRWAKEVSDIKTKTEFYPTLDKAILFPEGYIAERSSHSRGSTVDLTIVPLPAPEQPPYPSAQSLSECYLPVEQRFADNSIDMGTGFDCFHTLSHTRNPKLGLPQRIHRLLLETLMDKYGFDNYDMEWWHYTLRDEPYPETWFDFPIE
jgi:D-alanyl-D-alanine dipeptidase